MVGSYEFVLARESSGSPLSTAAGILFLLKVVEVCAV
jgi:hypothetical protein